MRKHRLREVLPTQKKGTQNTMLIRKATCEEMLRLWGYQDTTHVSPTARFFYQNISTGNAVFWTLDHDGELIGELYIFSDLDDKDFADGKTKAYLCAFRIKESYRGQGLGSALLEYVLKRLQESGIQEVTIGVEESEEANVALYRRFGFTEKVKDCFEDPCAIGEDMKPQKCHPFWLLSQKLVKECGQIRRKTNGI